MAGTRRVVIGSRSSSLSLAQTNEVVRLLRQAHSSLNIDVVSLSTRGDRNKSAPLLSMERGMFVKEIELALLSGEIDIAVHSAKDMPATIPPDLAIAAFPEREDARDVLVNRWNAPLSELPSGARLGTSSPRRTAQIKSARPDIEILPIRGNVDTRLQKAASDDYDGAVLAAAGILRLGRHSDISSYLSPHECVPDVGQGALAVQVRESDGEMIELVRAIDHEPTSVAVRAERAFLVAMGGGCTMPTAAYAEIRDDTLHLLGMVAKPDGSEIYRVSESYDCANPEEAGQVYCSSAVGSRWGTHNGDDMSKGIVWLVGAGPGDPDLISVKGLRLIQSADAIVFDRLVDKRLLDSAHEDAELIDVGKIPGKRINRQEDINSLLIGLGRAGKKVVRLKGGDPFVFGRGGEEAEALAEAAVTFEIVPGITSAIAAPAYAGIPLTHRKLASSFTVVTGSEDPTKPDTSVDWEVLAKSSDTLAILMGQSNLRSIAAALMKYGRAPETPVALVQWGTEPYQRTLVGTLSDIADRAATTGIGAPAVTIVGDVVRLRETIPWFDSRPLFGKRVLVTRTRTQASSLSDALTQRGAQPIELPTIEIQLMDDYTELDAALKNALNYDWMVFSSANAVDVVFDRLSALRLDSRVLHGVKIATIGPATRRRLLSHGIIADFMPTSFVAEGAVSELGGMGMNGTRVLLPQAEIARDVLRQGLAELGASVDAISVYRTVTPKDTSAKLRDILAEGIDIATFTSSSTASNLVELLEGNTSALKDATIACIGPITAERAAELGLSADVVAREHTIPGLIEAVESHFKEAG